MSPLEGRETAPDARDLTSRIGWFLSSPAPLIEEIRRRAGGDAVFGLWMLEADMALRCGSGLSIVDLEAWAWRDAYDDELDPAHAAEEALAADPWLGLLAMPAREARRRAARVLVDRSSAEVLGLDHTRLRMGFDAMRADSPAELTPDVDDRINVEQFGADRIVDRVDASRTEPWW